MSSWWKLLFCFLYNFLYFLIVYTFALRVRILLVSYQISPSEKSKSFYNSLGASPTYASNLKQIGWICCSSKSHSSIWHQVSILKQIDWCQIHEEFDYTFEVTRFAMPILTCGASREIWLLSMEILLSFIILAILQTSSFCN